MKNENISAELEKSDEGASNLGLRGLFLSELAYLLNAETQLTKALLKMSKAAEGDDLRDAITSHLHETEGHVERLQTIFRTLNEKPGRKACKSMQGMVEEGAEKLREQQDASVIDASIIATAQKVEHYEIASYGSLITWAKEMGHNDAADMLEDTLEEEKAADQALAEVAHSASR